MISLAGLVGLYFVSVILGKHSRKISAGTVVVILFLAIVQTAIVLFDMFTKQPPAQ